MKKAGKGLEGISAKELDEIKKRCEEASHRPWVWFEEDPGRPYDPMIKVLEVIESGHIRSLKSMFFLFTEEDRSHENAEFICKARDDIRKLIGVVEKLTGCGKTPLYRHPRESGSPEGIEKTEFLLPQE